MNIPQVSGKPGIGWKATHPRPAGWMHRAIGFYPLALTTVTRPPAQGIFQGKRLAPEARNLVLYLP
ncbi:MAG: hypothetical protein QME21_03875 [Anaerolineales bacterium]|nr:hypothetical protein [Anaerolineales bacterium]